MSKFIDFWRVLRRPSARYSAGSLIGGGIVVGIILLVGFNTAMELTNTDAFCISCHEMRTIVYEEYKKTTHFSNLSGVSALCADCHVPKEWTRRITRKIRAGLIELPLHFIGAVNTREKFEARRLDMAKRVWQRMKASDSRECRNCHDMASMDLVNQPTRARAQHESAEEEGETCIDCHKGLAHKPVHKELERTTEEEADFTLE